jgi:hypothetical protein
MATAKPSFFVLVPGFGQPNLPHKLSILENNLGVLSLLHFTGRFQTLRMTVCLYDTGDILLETLQAVQNRLRAIQLRFPQFFEFQTPCAPGIVGQFMIRHANPDALLERDPALSHCMILLDDVELNASQWTSDTWERVFHDYQRQHLHILSPTMCPQSKYLFPYMLQRKYPGDHDVLSITSACELFCYLMSMDAWRTYYAELRDEHPLLWGIDLVLTKHLHLRVGMIHYATLRHYYQSVQHPYCESSQEAFRQMQLYLSKFGETQQTLAHQPAILEDIHIYHRT